MSEQARKVKNEAIPQWVEEPYSNTGLFDEVLVYFDDEAVYVECRGSEDSGIVRFSHEMLETLKQVVEEE